MSDDPITFRDLGAEIFSFGGKLVGGEINFLGHLERQEKHQGAKGRVLVFDIDDNREPSHWTALAVFTPQRSAELRTILNTPEGGLMSIRVLYIGEPSPVMVDIDTGKDVMMRPVFGSLTWHPLVTRNGNQMLEVPGRMALKMPENLMVLPTRDAAGKVIHCHMIALDDAGKPVSENEKNERVAAMLDGLDPRGTARAEDEALAARNADGTRLDTPLDGMMRRAVL